MCIRDRDVQETFIEESMNDAIAGCKNAGAFENVRNRYLTGRMRQTIKRTVWAPVSYTHLDVYKRQQEVLFYYTDFYRNFISA